MKLWGGRFAGQINNAGSHSADSMAVDSFHSSISFDQRLYKHDINGSIVHAQMLGRQGIIPDSDSELIVKTLNEILADIDSGKLMIAPDAEDIHSFVEAELVSRIGDVGKRLHTARSRNDQVALDMRMYVKDELCKISESLLKLMEAIVNTAKKHTETIMPGYTHLQKAQPVTLSHHLLAYFEMFKRDFLRLSDCRKRTDIMPLGSGALAGSTYPIDREFVKEKLGFSEISDNSMDAVSDRDFCAEFIFCMSVVMMHLSRFCEELVLWSSDEFKFVENSDAYSTGSSIMPQKKNPDMAELIRGKTGRVYGNLLGLLTVMKGLPLSYNKDMQEDKEAVFDAADTVKACLHIFCGMFQSISFNTGVMRKSAEGGYTNATDAADWLVKKGMPFRKAHEIIGKLVLYAIDKKKSLSGLSLDEFKSMSDIFDKTIFDAISIETCVNARKHMWAASASAEEAIKKCEQFIEKNYE